MACDMCGADTKLFKAIIEGVEMNVCRDCSRFGKVIGEVKEEKEEKKPKKIIKATGATADAGPDVELLQVIVEDYAEKIKDAREKSGLKQKDFAKKINEKESLIHKIETGSFKPNISLARKIEKFLKIRLIEQHEEVHTKSAESKSDEFTIGDFVKIKKR
jgi:putative transcription factor